MHDIDRGGNATAARLAARAANTLIKVVGMACVAVFL